MPLLKQILHSRALLAVTMFGLGVLVTILVAEYVKGYEVSAGFRVKVRAPGAGTAEAISSHPYNNVDTAVVVDQLPSY